METALNEAETDLKALMLAGLNGDAAAYRRVLSMLAGLLRAYFRRRLSGGSDAEDLVQETLIAVHSKRHTFDRDMALTPWVYAIARYKLIDHLRRRSVTGIQVPIEDADAALSATDFEAGQPARDVSGLLDQLPERQRQAIRLTKIDGLSVREASERTGQSESAIKVNVHRGLNALARLVGKERG
jgi:RNA polymerase sigma-70 factor, ECF subfamily